MKRDLKADSEIVNRARKLRDANIKFGSERYGTSAHIEMMNHYLSFEKQSLEIAEHALERAIKAESLNQELVEAIEVITRYKNRSCMCGLFGHTPNENCEICEKYRSALKTVEKAKEVLGDDSQDEAET